MKIDFYVYLLFRADGRPMYIGKGRRNRWLDHERVANKTDTHRSRAVRKAIALIGEVPKIKLAEGLTAVEAAALEIFWIAAIGREPEGPLINQTRGGDGLVDPSPEVIERIRAKNRLWRPTKEQIAKMVANHPAITPEQRAKMIATNKARKHRRSMEARARMSAAKKGKPSPLKGTTLAPEHRAKLRGPRGPCPKMRKSKGHWFTASDGSTYLAFEQRSLDDIRGRKFL